MSAGAAELAGVTPDDFRAVSTRIINDGTPSAGHDLVGIEMHFDALLDGLDEVDDQSVSIHRTEHVERLIHATCRTAPGVPLGRAAEAVRDLWLSKLRYSYLEAHNLQIADGGATLDFITQIGPHRLYVTGRVRISPRMSHRSTRRKLRATRRSRSNTNAST